MLTRLKSAGVLLVLFTQLHLAAAADLAIVEGTCRDADSSEMLSCTVSLTDGEGKLVVLHPAFKKGFRSSGHFAQSVIPGQIRIRVTRGFETEAIEKELFVSAGTHTNVEFHLRKRVDMRQRGWFCGDSHAHMLHGERTFPVDFDYVALSAQAEELQYLSLAQAWSVEPATPERLKQELGSRSRPDCVLTWNLEAPKNYYKGDAGRCLGHCWTLGMLGRTPEGQDVIRELLAASAWDYESEKASFANFESHRLIHSRGGAVFYTHPARWWTGPWGGQGGYPKRERMKVSNMAVELPLDTILGPTYDGIDVLTTAGEREANAKAFAIWALLLNHGYRLAATASSDSCFDRPGGAIPGSARTYSFLEGKFSLERITRATASGHTVATTGPLLIPLLDGKPPGTVFSSGTKPRMLSIQAWAPGCSKEGLQAVEVLRNGKLWKQYLLPNRPEAFNTNIQIREIETAWYCVRAAAAGEGGQLAISSAFYFQGSGFRPPAPQDAQVTARIEDATSGRPLKGRLVEVAMYGTSPKSARSHRVKTAEAHFSMPADLRLRAEVPGYGSVTLSPFFDNPALVKKVTELSDPDLSSWNTFEEMRQYLNNVELVFRLEKE